MTEKPEVNEAEVPDEIDAAAPTHDGQYSPYPDDDTAQDNDDEEVGK